MAFKLNAGALTDGELKDTTLECLQNLSGDNVLDVLKSFLGESEEWVRDELLDYLTGAL